MLKRLLCEIAHIKTTVFEGEHDWFVKVDVVFEDRHHIEEYRGEYRTMAEAESQRELAKADVIEELNEYCADDAANLD